MWNTPHCQEHHSRLLRPSWQPTMEDTLRDWECGHLFSGLYFLQPVPLCFIPGNKLSSTKRVLAAHLNLTGTESQEQGQPLKGRLSSPTVKSATPRINNSSHSGNISFQRFLWQGLDNSNVHCVCYSTSSKEKAWGGRRKAPHDSRI